MAKRTTFGATGLLATTMVLLGTTVSAWDRHHFGHRNTYGRTGQWSFGFGGMQVGHVPEPRGPLVYAPNGQLKQYFDSTGRWTGDGYDTMSTAKPTPQTAGR